MLSEGKWMVVGLGNPGARYEDTPHNLGFMVVDALAGEMGVPVKREECRALVGQGRLGGEVVELVKPQTYMNLSGESLSCFLKKADRSQDRIVVVTDDLALPLGSIRVRPSGSHGGHNGLRSIIACLQSQDFKRVRIGILPAHPVSDASAYVLGRFGASDREAVREAVERASQAVAEIIRSGIDRAMAKFNGMAGDAPEPKQPSC